MLLVHSVPSVLILENSFLINFSMSVVFKLFYVLFVTHTLTLFFFFINIDGLFVFYLQFKNLSLLFSRGLSIGPFSVFTSELGEQFSHQLLSVCGFKVDIC